METCVLTNMVHVEQE